MIGAPAKRALDVGCGTGISTMAIGPLAEMVTGIEPSPSMLELAKSSPSVNYVRGTAEDLPMGDRSVDLIGVGSAIHWFDQSEFAGGASRVARPEAWLIHDHWFSGQMEGRPEFADWGRGTYLEKFPAPPREKSWRPPADLGTWKHVTWERYDHPVVMTVDQLANYLLTQSNLQVVLAMGKRTENELRAWLH